MRCEKKCLYSPACREYVCPSEAQSRQHASTSNWGLWKLLFNSSGITSTSSRSFWGWHAPTTAAAAHPGAHDANHGGSAKGGQVKSTEFTRQINARGLNKVKLSIKTKGWVNSNTPYVLVPREQLPSGKDTVFSTELLGTLTVYCLDGNHRIHALLELEGAEFSVDCRLYLHFDCAETINALARSEYTYRIFVSSCRYVLDFVRLVFVLFVCVFFPFMLDIKFVGRTSRGHTGGRSHRIYHPPFCGARLNFYIFCTTTSSSSRL